MSGSASLQCGLRIWSQSAWAFGSQSESGSALRSESRASCSPDAVLVAVRVRPGWCGVAVLAAVRAVFARSELGSALRSESACELQSSTRFWWQSGCGPAARELPSRSQSVSVFGLRSELGSALPFESVSEFESETECWWQSGLRSWSCSEWVSWLRSELGFVSESASELQFGTGSWWPSGW